MKVHRWQPTGFAPCGRALKSIVWNEQQMLDDGVTCSACKRSKTRVGYFPPRPHPAKEVPTD